MTAGNSTPLTDGASAVLLASDEWAAEHTLPVLAHFVDAETAAVDYVHGDRKADGLLMAPVYALPRLLARNNLTLQDFDFYEIHEAFASTVLTTLAAWEDAAFCQRRSASTRRSARSTGRKLNVNGSSLAAGHPFAATGGRIVATLAKMLHEKGSGRGLISICAAGGQGVVAILEGSLTEVSDRYLNLVNSPVGSKVASHASGCPDRRCCAATRPATRCCPGRCCSARPGPRAAALTQDVLTAAGVEVRDR